jgi:glyoxylase-like metal-dependent hydrolase (beta-lactamase superfamily II)
MALWAAAAVATVSGQDSRPSPENSLRAEFVKTGLYMISGGGANSVVRLSGNGLILVDGKRAGEYDPLLARIKKISDQPVRVLIETGASPDRCGNNAQFLEDATGIIAQESLKHSLQTGLPTVFYERDYTVRLGGVEARLFHFGNARSAGDTVVYFPNLRAVAVGDLVAGMPDPDFEAGGSLVGWGPVLGEILKLDFDVAIPSYGPPVTRAQVEGFKAQIDSVVARGVRLVREGVAKDRLMERLNAEGSGWRLNFRGVPLDRFYGELKNAR